MKTNFCEPLFTESLFGNISTIPPFTTSVASLRRLF